MTTPQTRAIAIPLPGGTAVSGLLTEPRAARAAYVLAHGAGAGMSHPFMNAVAEQLGVIATSRRCAISFRIWSMDRGDPTVPQWRMQQCGQAVAEARRQVGDLPLSPAGNRSAAE